jgi:hypothetical protein
MLNTLIWRLFELFRIPFIAIDILALLGGFREFRSANFVPYGQDGIAWE